MVIELKRGFVVETLNVLFVEVKDTYGAFNLVITYNSKGKESRKSILCNSEEEAFQMYDKLTKAIADSKKVKFFN